MGGGGGVGDPNKKGGVRQKTQKLISGGETIIWNWRVDMF